MSHHPCEITQPFPHANEKANQPSIASQVAQSHLNHLTDKREESQDSEDSAFVPEPFAPYLHLLLLDAKPSLQKIHLAQLPQPITSHSPQRVTRRGRDEA